MQASTARFIIDTIDGIHRFYEKYSFIAIFAFLFTFLPKKEKFESKYDKVLSYIILVFLIHLTTVFLSQGIFGGCLYHLVQNHLAREYLNMDLWRPFGIVYRENWYHLAPNNHRLVEIILQLIYLVLGSVVLWRTRVFYLNRIKHPTLKERKSREAVKHS